MKTRLLIITVVATIMTISIPHVFAASLFTHIDPYEEQIKPSFQFQKSIIIFYDETGKLREEMHQKDIQIYFSENSSNPQVFDLMQKLNQNLEDLSSQAKITELDVTFKARMKGYNLTGLFDYEITLVPTITNFVDKTHPDPPSIIDTRWRGIEISDEIIIPTEKGEIDINHPVSFIKQIHPGFYEAIQGTAAYPILAKPMIDSTGLSKNLAEWEFVFQPKVNPEESLLSIPLKWQGWNVSTFMTGNFSTREGNAEEIIDMDVVSDKTYPIKIIHTLDRGFINVKGFASVDFLDGNEILTTTPLPPYSPTVTDGTDLTWILFLIIGIITSLLVFTAYYLSRSRK
jgi:hypothetical protein